MNFLLSELVSCLLMYCILLCYPDMTWLLSLKRCFYYCSFHIRLLCFVVVRAVEIILKSIIEQKIVITLPRKSTEKHLPSLSHGINTLKGLTVLDQRVAIKTFFKSMQKAMNEMTGLNTANL